MKTHHGEDRRLVHWCLVAAFLAAGLMLRHLLARSGGVLARRTSLLEELALLSVGVVSLLFSVALAYTWARGPQVGRGLLLVGVALLLIRAFFPFLVLVTPVVRLLGLPDGYAYEGYAYDREAGTWFWLLLHGAGFLVPAGLLRHGRTLLALAFLVTWTLATAHFVSGSSV